MPLLLSHEQVRPWLVDAGAALELLCSRPPLLLRTSVMGSWALMICFEEAMDQIENL